MAAAVLGGSVAAAYAGCAVWPSAEDRPQLDRRSGRDYRDRPLHQHRVRNGPAPNTRRRMPRSDRIPLVPRLTACAPLIPTPRRKGSAAQQAVRSGTWPLPPHGGNVAAYCASAPCPGNGAHGKPRLPPLAQPYTARQAQGQGGITMTSLTLTSTCAHARAGVWGSPGPTQAKWLAGRFGMSSRTLTAMHATRFPARQPRMKRSEISSRGGSGSQASGCRQDTSRPTAAGPSVVSFELTAMGEVTRLQPGAAATSHRAVRISCQRLSRRAGRCCCPA